ncbi:MAG: enoyl-CoA hydratase/isomerase family protein [Chloroflexi bacterium]|nr:enoyl-CoA hydratase/isomerase family protein [Chloroflexota bacterium]
MAIRRYELLKSECTGHIATITLDRPEKLNALNSLMTAELHSVLDELSNEDDIRVVILTGAGRGFCSGADVNELAVGRLTPSTAAPGTGITALSSRIRRNNQPVIAAVNGVAAGAGLSIALASDIRIASEEASFSSIFVKRSLVPDAGLSYTLPRLVGLGVAMEMALTGNIYDANWALGKGLVNRVVPADKLMEEAMALASDIASNPPICVRSTKELLYDHDEDLLAILKKENDANIPLGDSEDALEAIRSFLEKRPPDYKGR